ncbi:MAG TPA: hypothetical protein DDZ51_19505 [Planctomycetaceae bacterium]|nr:hypothetical protein [Planctomycetaceae bacterium]
MLWHPRYWVQKIVWDTDGIDAHVLELPTDVLMVGDPEGFADRLAGQSAGQFGWCIHTLEVQVCDATLSEPQQRFAATLPLLVGPAV